MDREHSLAAGIAAALASVSAAAPDASADILYTRSNLTGAAEATQFIALTQGELHRPPTALLTWGTGLALPPGPHDQQFALDTPPTFDAYVLIGIDQDGGVLVSFEDPSAAIGRPFESLFPGFSELALVDALRNDPTGGMVVDFITLLDSMPSVGTPMGIECACVHLSVGADYGVFTASFAPIPAPAAVMVMLIGGGLGIVRRRRAE